MAGGNVVSQEGMIHNNAAQDYRYLKAYSYLQSFTVGYDEALCSVLLFIGMRRPTHASELVSSDVGGQPLGVVRI